MSGYVEERKAVLESLLNNLCQLKLFSFFFVFFVDKNGSLHTFPPLLSVFARLFHLGGELSVRKVQLQELPQARADAPGVRLQVRAGPVHGGEVAGNGGLPGGVAAPLPPAAGQRGLLQPELQLRAAGRRAEVCGLSGAAGVRECDEEGAVPEALQAGAASFQTELAQQRHHR